MGPRLGRLALGAGALAATALLVPFGRAQETAPAEPAPTPAPAENATPPAPSAAGVVTTVTKAPEGYNIVMPADARPTAAVVERETPEERAQEKAEAEAQAQEAAAEAANAANAADAAALNALPPAPPPALRGRGAVLRVLDKVTNETSAFEAPIGVHVRYKSLIFTVRACETRGQTDPQPRRSAYLTIESQAPTLDAGAAAPLRRVYSGWMFAESPSLHPLEHPVYDAWLERCLPPTV